MLYRFMGPIRWFFLKVTGVQTQIDAFRDELERLRKREAALEQKLEHYLRARKDETPSAHH